MVETTTSNPYASPQAELSAPPPETPAELTKEEVEAFVGSERASYFWGVWRPSAPSLWLFAGFNWAAVVLNVVWLLYRKMYREFGVAIALIVAGAVLSIPLGIAEVGSLVNAVVVVVIGALGNGLYRRRARLVIGAARAREPELEKRLAILRKKGGVAWLWPVLLLVLVVLFALASRRPGE
jgi:Protein of unknown function (DUF2628)